MYIKEAHPEDEWQVSVNESDDICYAQPRNIEERLTIATDFVQHFDYALPLVVDTMKDEAMKAYAGWPERLYIIDGEGRVAYKGGMGPMSFEPDEVEDWLRERFGSGGQSEGHSERR